MIQFKIWDSCNIQNQFEIWEIVSLVCIFYPGFSTCQCHKKTMLEWLNASLTFKLHLRDCYLYIFMVCIYSMSHSPGCKLYKLRHSYLSTHHYTNYLYHPIHPNNPHDSHDAHISLSPACLVNDSPLEIVDEGCGPLPW